MSQENLKFTESHEWAGLEAGVVTVGISDHAQTALGDVTYVEVPEVGDEVKKGGEACSIESCKAAASVYSPVDGKIMAVNEALEDTPELINSDPYGEGWIFKIKPADASQLDSLMNSEEYKTFLTKQDD